MYQIKSLRQRSLHTEPAAAAKEVPTHSELAISHSCTVTTNCNIVRHKELTIRCSKGKSPSDWPAHLIPSRHCLHRQGRTKMLTKQDCLRHAWLTVLISGVHLDQFELTNTFMIAARALHTSLNLCLQTTVGLARLATNLKSNPLNAHSTYPTSPV